MTGLLSPARLDPVGSRAPWLDFVLPANGEATEPPEVRLGRRDAVRLMVSRGSQAPIHSTADRLADHLDPGDLVVVNTSATVPAAVDAVTEDGAPVTVHLSTELPTGLWLVEARRPEPDGTSRPHDGEFDGKRLRLPGGATIRLLDHMPGSRRLWVAIVELGQPVVEYLTAHGRPIRYRYVPESWPIDAYRNSFAVEPGSAEMPSAGRPVTADVITSLVARGVSVTPVCLHTGVSSLEGGEMPYPERYHVPVVTARRVNEAHRSGGRVVAIGMTVVRALETVTDRRGVTHAGHGWTDLVVTPERGVRAVDGLLTGWHEPEATHLLMLEAVAGRAPLAIAYPEALAAGYLWHEFGDSHLLLPDGAARRSGVGAEP